MTVAFALIRALHFASLMGVFGASALLAQARRTGIDVARFRVALFMGSVVALVTAVLWLFFVSAEMGGGGKFGLHVTYLVLRGTYFGDSFVQRAWLLVALCGLCLLRDVQAVKAVIAGAALALLGWTSHAAAAGNPRYDDLRAGIDALHLLAAGFWLGGLVVLVPQVLAKPRNIPRLTALLRLFSRWGAVSVAVLIVAGTLNAVAILDVPGMRWSGTYVTLLAIKIVLAAVMVALALTNRFGVLPGLERGEAEASETIPLTVLAELGAALLIVLIVGFLGLEPPMAM